MFQGTEFTKKLKKIRRLGEIVFEDIKTKNQFSAILDDLMMLLDFRRGAMFNVDQFRNEPKKIDFFLALFEKQLLRVPVLMVNKQIFAAVGTIWS